MVKTTKILLIFLQTFEGNVGKKIFFGVFVGKEENRKGAIKPWPLCTPLGLFFRSSWLWWCEVVDLCMYAAVLDVWGWADVCGCGWCWRRTARRVAVAWLRGCVYGCGWRSALLSPGWGFFLFFACGGVGVTCIVEYWDALHRVFYRIFWKRNDDFFGFVQVFWFVWLVADVL